MTLEDRTAEYLTRFDDLATAPSRKAFLYVVFGDAGFLGSVDYEGSPREFCRRLVAQLSRLGALAAGRDTVIVLLEATQTGDLGPDDLRTAGELIAAWRLQGRGRVAAGDDEPPPYKGLQYFDVADADLFFGRDRLIGELVAFLCDQPLLAVVGASGSGKSSVVRAGVLPALTNGKHLAAQARRPAGSARWPVQLLTPTARPLESLAASLTRGSESVSATATLIDDLARDSRSLHLFARRLLAPGGPGDRLLLVVDQFEELFTLCRDRGERKAFVDNLLTAAAPDGVTTVVLTLRADFYAQCAEFPNLRQALERCQRYIGAMSQDELRSAIEAPAQQGGWELEPGLVDLLLEDVSSEPGALPLLSHALLETWKRRSDRALTLAGYQASGRVQGAIARTADDTFGRLTVEQQAIARNIFLRLTELGEGVQDTRRRVPLGELLPDPAANAAVADVVQTLQDARLVTAEAEPGSPTVYLDVAHEALIREWPALREWLADDREGLRIQRRLTEAAQEWERLGRDLDALYRGVRLEQARAWMADHVGELSAQERAFVEASQALAEAEQRAAEQVQQEREQAMWREVEAARALAQASEARAREAARARSWLALFLFVTCLLIVRLVRDGWTWIAQQQVLIVAALPGEPPEYGDFLMMDSAIYRLPGTLVWGVIFLGLAAAARRLAMHGKALRDAATTAPASAPGGGLVAGSGRLGPTAGTVVWVAGWILVGVFLFLTVDFIAFGGDLSAAAWARLSTPGT